jgi:hypothetical protein
MHASRGGAELTERTARRARRDLPSADHPIEEENNWSGSAIGGAAAGQLPGVGRSGAARDQIEQPGLGLGLAFCSWSPGQIDHPGEPLRALPRTWVSGARRAHRPPGLRRPPVAPGHQPARSAAARSRPGQEESVESGAVGAFADEVAGGDDHEGSLARCEHLALVRSGSLPGSHLALEHHRLRSMFRGFRCELIGRARSVGPAPGNGGRDRVLRARRRGSARSVSCPRRGRGRCCIRTRYGQVDLLLEANRVEWTTSTGRGRSVLVKRLQRTQCGLGPDRVPFGWGLNRSMRPSVE